MHGVNRTSRKAGRPRTLGSGFHRHGRSPPARAPGHAGAEPLHERRRAGPPQSSPCCVHVSQSLRKRVDTNSPALEGLAADVRDVEVRDAELLLSVEQLRRDALDGLAVLVLFLRLVHAAHVELHVD